MEEFSEKAKEFIKLHGSTCPSNEGLLELSTLQMFTMISLQFPYQERKLIFHTLRKVFYINHILVWKISYYVHERRNIQSEFEILCKKWEWADSLIKTYNNIIGNSNEKKMMLPLIETATKDFAPITVFKSGKIQLQNKYIQRVFEKVRNKHKNRLIIYTIISSLMKKYITKYNLSEFINDNVKQFLEELESDLAHSVKYSSKEYLLNYAFKEDSNEKKEAKKYAVYPAFNEISIDIINKPVYIGCSKLLFSDLEQIEEWQEKQWGI